MKALAQCISHSPAMGLRPLGDERGPAVARALADACRALAAFAPQLVVLFTPDHYNGFFYDLMPAFCVGARASGVGDFGTSAGSLEVDGEAAYRLHEHLLADGFDPAVSHDMRVDHAVMQIAERILPPGVQTIPVFINCASPPLPPSGGRAGLAARLAAISPPGRAALRTSARGVCPTTLRFPTSAPRPARTASASSCAGCSRNLNGRRGRRAP